MFSLMFTLHLVLGPLAFMPILVGPLWVVGLVWNAWFVAERLSTNPARLFFWHSLFCSWYG